MRVHGNGIWRLRNSVFSGFSRKLSFYPHLRVIKPWSKITDLSFSEEHVNAKKVKKKQIRTSQPTFYRGSQTLLKFAKKTNSFKQNFDAQHPRKIQIYKIMTFRK